MCIEREKVDFKSREVNCLKECALALRLCYIRNMYMLVYIYLVKYKRFFSDSVSPPVYCTAGRVKTALAPVEVIT